MFNIPFFSLLWVSFVHSLLSSLGESEGHWFVTFFKDLFIYLFIYLFLAVLGIRCYTWTFLQLRQARAILLRCSTWTSWDGFSCCTAWALHVLQACRLQQSQHTGLFALWHVGSFRIRDWIPVPCIGRWIRNHWTTRETQFVIIFFFSNMDI